MSSEFKGWATIAEYLILLHYLDARYVDHVSAANRLAVCSVFSLIPHRYVPTKLIEFNLSSKHEQCNDRTNMQGVQKPCPDLLERTKLLDRGKWMKPRSPS